MRENSCLGGRKRNKVEFGNQIKDKVGVGDPDSFHALSYHTIHCLKKSYASRLIMDNTSFLLLFVSYFLFKKLIFFEN